MDIVIFMLYASAYILYEQVVTDKKLLSWGV